MTAERVEKELECKNEERINWTLTSLFCNKTDSVLEGFLSELLKSNVMVVKFLEKKRGKNEKNDKIDVLVKTEDDLHIVVEIQLNRHWNYLSQMLHTSSKLIVENAEWGILRLKLKKTISVCIVFSDKVCGEGCLYHGKTEFRGIHQKGRESGGDDPIANELTESKSNCAEYYLLMVNQFKGNINNAMDEWMSFFQTGQIRPEFTAKGLQEIKNNLSEVGKRN